MVGATFLEHFCNMLVFSIFLSFYDGFDMFYMSRAASSFRNVQRCREGNSAWDAMLNLVALNYFDFDRFGLLSSTANAHLNIGVLSLLFPMFRWREKAARMSKDCESWCVGSLQQHLQEDEDVPMEPDEEEEDEEDSVRSQKRTDVV